MVPRHLAVVILFLATVACGDGNGSPTAPSLNAAITGLSITPATVLIKLRASEAFIATATFANGSSTSVPAIWGSDNPEVASVDSSGHATGTNSGQARIFADYQGQRATRLLRVVPDYEGLWRGTWRVVGCTEQGDWCGLCKEFTTGALWGLALDVFQSGDAITGTVDFGRMPGPVSGSIRLSGHLLLSGTYTITIADQDIQVRVTEWETITTNNKRMTGRFRAAMQGCWCEGSLAADGELHVVIKTAGGPEPDIVGGAGSLDRVVARQRLRP